MSTRRERLEASRELTSRMAQLAYDIYRQWWRPLKNARRRREMRRLLDESERTP